jgi:hypothetical protein
MTLSLDFDLDFDLSRFFTLWGLALAKGLGFGFA